MESNQIKDIAIEARSLSSEELDDLYRNQHETVKQAEAALCGYALEMIRRLLTESYPEAHTAVIGVEDWDNQCYLFLDSLYNKNGEFIDFEADKISGINKLVANLERCYGQEEVLLAIDPTEEPLLIQN